MLVANRWVNGVVLLGALALSAGCATPEEKALAKERVALLKAQNDIVTVSGKDCGQLAVGLGDFEKANSARISDLRSKWSALSESKKKSLMKPHRKESDPYFRAMIGPLVRCGTVFPVK